MTVRDFISYFDGVIDATEALFREVPSDAVNWRPADTGFTVGQQMLHMGQALGAFSRGLFGEPWGFSSVREILVGNRSTRSAEVNEAIELLRRNYGVLRERLAALSEEEFDTVMIDSPQLGRVPRWTIALFGLEHHLAHKTELFMSMKLFGVKVDTRHLYRLR